MKESIAISALQHYAFCPRQFALIHVEQAWAENRFTMEGQILHRRVDSGVKEQRGKLRYERGVELLSDTFGLKGKMDLLEVEDGSPVRLYPVEYKRGKPKVEGWDKIQLCAQALCLEEMRNTEVKEGAIWYWEARKREKVDINTELREATIEAIDSARRIITSGSTPLPTVKKQRCQACSLKNLCEPDTFRRDWSADYIKQICP